jgi:hypothetical protein
MTPSRAPTVRSWLDSRSASHRGDAALFLDRLGLAGQRN